MAGGKGELAFELLNLNGLPATVLEPRPLELQRRVKWLLVRRGGGWWCTGKHGLHAAGLGSASKHVDTAPGCPCPFKPIQQHASASRPQNGFYHWNPHHACYNDRVWISSTLEQQAQQGMQQQQPQQQPEAAANQSSVAQSAATAGSVHMPDHLRLVISPALAACLVGRAADSSAGPPPSLPPPDWPAVFEQARQEAHHGRWLKPALPHEPAAPAAAGGKHSSESGTEDGTRTPVEPAEPAAPKTPEPVKPGLVTLAAPLRRRAVAWSIPADSESEQEEAWWCRAAGISSFGSFGSSSSAAAAPGSPLAERPQQEQQQQEQQQQPAKWRQAEHAQQEPRDLDDAAEAWRRLTQCSVVVGMHPDQATGAHAHWLRGPHAWKLRCFQPGSTICCLETKRRVG